MLRTIVLTLILAAAAPAVAQWRVAETPHVRLYGQLNDDELRRQAVLLEDFRSLLSTMTTVENAEAIGPLDIYLVPKIALASPFHSIDDNIAGFYRASDRGIIAFAVPGIAGQRTLLHEYAHHFMLASGRSVYPAWYVEGFAEYFMTATFFPERVNFGDADRNRLSWLVGAESRWLKLERILARDLKSSDDETALFYAQSWLLTHYLFRTPAMRDKLKPYLDAVAMGADPVDAFREHVEPDLAKLRGTLQRYMRSRAFTYSQWKRPAAARHGDVTVRTIAGPSDKLLLLIASMDTAAPVSDRGAALQKVRAAVAGVEKEPLARRALLLAERHFGEPERAVAIADELLTTSPDDVDLLRWKAEALLAGKGLSAETRSAARRLLVKAFKLRPDDWRVMHVYLHTYDLEHEPLGDTQLEVLFRAVELAPHVDGLGIDLVAALVQRGRWEDAAKALRPIANRPHGGGYARLAQALAPHIAKRDKAAFVSALDSSV